MPPFSVNQCEACFPPTDDTTEEYEPRSTRTSEGRGSTGDHCAQATDWQRRTLKNTKTNGTPSHPLYLESRHPRSKVALTNLKRPNTSLLAAICRPMTVCRRRS